MATGLGGFLNTRALAREIGGSSSTALAKSMRKWARTLETNSRNQNDIKRVNKETANLARDAVRNAYASSGIGKRPSYRQNDPGKLRRYSGGAMEKALHNPKFIQADASGIRFVNKPLMDKYAKQWYRLNFGALPKRSKTPAVGSMKFFGKASKSKATLAGYGPSEPFTVPQSRIPGFWSSTFVANSTANNARSSSFGKKFTANKVRGAGALYLRRRGMSTSRNVKFFQSTPSEGIEGKRFLDKGAKAINEQYPIKITAMFQKWESRARKVMN